MRQVEKELRKTDKGQNLICIGMRDICVIIFNYEICLGMFMNNNYVEWVAGLKW